MIARREAARIRIFCRDCIMSRMTLAAIALLVTGATGAPACAPAARLSAAERGAEVVHVAPPTGIWVSAGSEENEILGNTFEDIAAHAVVLEGGRNRVETRGARDGVRDPGSGNRLSLAPDGLEAVRRLTDRFIAAWNDDFPDLVARFYADDAVLTSAAGTALEGRYAIVESFLRPNVARIGGMRPAGDPQISGAGDTITLDGRYRARFAPAPDSVTIRVSNRWVLQSDGSWLITASSFDLPTDEMDGPIRSRFIHSDGTRLHYLDFGGDGLPLVFIPSANRTAYTYIDFAARFTDRHRVLALTRRGSGQSGGAAGEAITNVARLARDVLALLDSLGIERAIVIDRWTEIPVFLAEQHPERLAALVMLRGVPPEPDPFELRARDVTRLLEMYDRAGAAMFGGDPNRSGPRREDWYEPRFRRTGAKIEVPTLLFMIESATPRWAVEWEFRVGLADEVATDPQSFPDSLSRSYFQRLAADAQLQAAVQAFYQDAFAPAWQAAERAFFDAFSNPRMVRLEGENPRSYYQYRHSPELIFPHIRDFLAEVGDREQGRSDAAASGSDIVHVAPPMGEPEADRASIVAALAQVRPGGTVQFAPGTYLIGEIIPVPIPSVMLLGHPQGTTLRGCTPDEYEEMESDAAAAGDDWRARFIAVRGCGTFEFTGGHATVRGFGLEYTRMGLILGCCHADREHRPTEGGYIIEGNTFRNSGNGVRPGLLSTEPTVIRGNRFINTYHAVSAMGGHLHVLDNDMSVPDPDRVPGVGHPSFAISFCGDHNVVAGNRIEGYLVGVEIHAWGEGCRHNVIRDNTVLVRRIRLAAEPGIGRSGESDSTIVGVPVALLNESGNALLEHNLIEGNRILGAEGIGIEVLRASRNRVINNTITGIRARDPFPGNTLGYTPEWQEANGSAIWVSRGSEENEILGNTFEDIASDAIVLEGDRNRVDTRDAGDSVRDLGSGNRVSPPPAAQPSRQEGEPIVIGQRLTLRSHVLGEDRQVLIRLPDGYDGATERYPVIYVLDGDTHFLHLSEAARVLGDRVPGLIVVGVTNPERDRDLTPNEAREPFVIPVPFSADTVRFQLDTAAARADDFLRFLHEELVPFIDGRYRTAPFRLLFGHSLGGLFTTHAFLTRPESFHAYIASSPSLVFYRSALEQMVPERMTTDAFEGRFFFSTVGEEEPWNVWGDGTLAWAFERFRPAGLRWWHRVLAGEAHGTVSYLTAYDGLRAIFSDYAIPVPTFVAGDLPALEAHLARASRIYGYEIAIPERLVNWMGRERLGFGDVAGAIRIFHRNVELHAGSPGAYDSLAEALEAAGELEEALRNRDEAVRRAEETGDRRLETFRRKRDALRGRVAAGSDG
jgi:uncharacterized protein